MEVLSTIKFIMAGNIHVLFIVKVIAEIYNRFKWRKFTACFVDWNLSVSHLFMDYIDYINSTIAINKSQLCSY